MSDLKEKIENLRTQQEQAKEIFVMCQGAIEVLEGLLEDEEEAEEENTDGAIKVKVQQNKY